MYFSFKIPGTFKTPHTFKHLAKAILYIYLIVFEYLVDYTYLKTYSPNLYRKEVFLPGKETLVIFFLSNIRWLTVSLPNIDFFFFVTFTD